MIWRGGRKSEGRGSTGRPSSRYAIRGNTSPDAPPLRVANIEQLRFWRLKRRIGTSRMVATDLASRSSPSRCEGFKVLVEPRLTQTFPRLSRCRSHSTPSTIDPPEILYECLVEDPVLDEGGDGLTESQHLPHRFIIC